MLSRGAVCSHSLGRAWVHELPAKLDQAARFNLDIELFYEDLEYLAKTLPGSTLDEQLIAAAHVVRELCDARDITVVCLQPFMHYEGLRDRQRHARRVKEMALWVELAKILHTHIIAIPSTCLSDDEVSGDLDLIVRDLQEVADLTAADGIQLAYEALCWGTHSDTWEQAWEIVRRVDRPNFGICIDTFNLAGRIYADPASPTRKTPNADAVVKASLERLVKNVDVEKIVYVQVVDAEYLAEPLIEGHEYYDPEQLPRMSWSRNCRLFYGEEDRGAYLPIKAILKALIVDLGFQGWISSEYFNRDLVDPSPSAPADLARRAAESWGKIVKDFNLHGESAAKTRTIEALEPAPRAQL